MSPNKTILITSSIYIILFIGMAIKFINTKFTGSDAAGNGMSAGLTFLYGLAFLFVVAVVITVINAFLYSGITQTWIKVLFFIPIGMPVLVFAHEVLEIGTSRPPSIEKQAHRLSIEIRSNIELENPYSSFRTSTGGSSGKLKLEKTEENQFYYESNHAIYYESDRKFFVGADSLATEELYFDIPYKPNKMPFSEWKQLRLIENESNDSIKIECRYQVTKRD